MEKHKSAALSFLRAAASGDVRAAFARQAAPGFRHHNPFFAGDAESLMTALEENARKNPAKLLEVQRAFEDGDFVAVHSRVRMNPEHRGFAAVHIFRFDGERIAEFWDIVQEVPAESPNQLGMF